MKKLISIFMISCCFCVWCEPKLTYDTRTHRFSLSDAENISKELQQLVYAHSMFSFTLYEWVDTMENLPGYFADGAVDIINGKDRKEVADDFSTTLAGKLYQFGAVAKKVDQAYADAFISISAKESTLELKMIDIIKQQLEKDMEIFAEASKKMSFLFK